MGFSDMRRAKIARGEDKVKRQPVHIQVTVGRRARAAYGDVYGRGKAVTRSNEGSPILKDRFFILEATPTDSVTLGGHEAKARRPHPDYMTREDGRLKPQGFSTIHGMVINARRDEWLDSRLGMWADPNGKRLSNRRPWCSSADFKTAERWDGHEFKPMKCPYRDCRYYGKQGGCKPTTSAVFMMREADRVGSNLIARWSTNSPLTWELLEGFVTQVEEQLAGLGLGDNWHGIRFTMTVTEGTGNGRRYPLVEFKLDGPIDHALMERYTVIARLKQLQAAAQLPQTDAAALLPAPTAGDMSDEWGEADSLDLTAEPLRPTTAPAAIIEEEPEPKPAPLPDGIQRAPSGEPVCWFCGGLMATLEGRTGIGYLCGCGAYLAPDGTTGKQTRRGSKEDRHDS